MTKANECTCPSGDGSLRHPCPAHPALVEQAGGDERAAFRPAQVISYRPGVGEVTIYVAGRVPGYMNIGDTVYVSDRAPVEQPIAALAQPSPVSEALIYACKNLAQITSSDGSGHADIALAVLRMAGVGDDERERLVNEWKAARAWKPSPAQAEAERPPQPERYTADVFHPERPYYMAQTSVVRASDFDEFATQYERIVGALRAELQAAEDRADTLEHRMMGMMTRHFAEAWRNRDTQKALDGYLSAGIAQLEQQRDAALSEVERLRQFERICEGLPQDAIDGGWTVQGIRAHSKQLEEQLKVALARVAELEKQEPVAYVLFRDGEVYYETDDNIVISNTPGDETDLYRWLPVFTAPAAQAQQLHDLDKQCRDDVARALGLRPSQERGFAWSYLLASIKSCVKASEDAAQAQHSVPEGYALIPVRETEAMHDAVMALLYKGVARTDTQKLLDAYIAAAPGKEG
ncbi:hypothetical protein [Pseudomonas aeruginosa]|uniref:hypothetical protein n=1 Tax=Pseudomonas aeruginosa TaxID=287 RepID=UPI00397AAF79